MKNLASRHYYIIHGYRYSLIVSAFARSLSQRLDTIANPYKDFHRASWHVSRQQRPNAPLATLPDLTYPLAIQMD